MITSKAFIQQYFDSLSGRNLTPVSDYFSNEIIWTLPPAHPFGGPFIGLEAVMEMMGRGSTLFRFETIAINLHTLIAEGDNVVAHFSLSAKTPDNRDYSNEYLLRFLCQQGKIVAVWEFMDTYYQHQMGMFGSD